MGMGAITNIATKGGGAIQGGAEVAGSSLESKAFLASMQLMQKDANAAALSNASLTNEKALVDALGKNIKSTGESVKTLGPQ